MSGANGAGGDLEDEIKRKGDELQVLLNSTTQEGQELVSSSVIAAKRRVGRDKLNLSLQDAVDPSVDYWLLERREIYNREAEVMGGNEVHVMN